MIRRTFLGCLAALPTLNLVPKSPAGREFAADIGHGIWLRILVFPGEKVRAWVCRPVGEEIELAVTWEHGRYVATYNFYKNIPVGPTIEKADRNSLALWTNIVVEADRIVVDGSAAWVDHAYGYTNWWYFAHSTNRSKPIIRAYC